MNQRSVAWCVLLLVCFAFKTRSQDNPKHRPVPGKEVQREERLAWWHEAKFGMFIHWGLYSQLGGEWKGGYYQGIGEWIMYKARIPLAEYEGVARQFNPVKFDAEAWAQLAEDAGMKYLIITSKHHDGFAMFGSKADGFNILDATPFGRDPIRELSAACKKRGIRFGVYYSQAQDWSAPGGAIWKGPHESDPVWEVPQWDPKQNGDFDTYFNTKALPQVGELLSNYGPVSVIWFDTPLGVMNAERAAKLQRIVHELQPDCLVNGRLGGKFQSDYDSEGDNAIPNLSRAGAWETPATLNHTWGYKKHDTHWKSAASLIFKLVDIVSKGGNYLLNVGPDGEGVIPPASQDTLRVVGCWLKVNGESIYGAGRTPFGAEFGSPLDKQKSLNAPSREWRCEACGATQEQPSQFEPLTAWRCTTKPGKLYIHIFSWPVSGKLELPGIKDKIRNAYFLADPRKEMLKFRQTGKEVSITLPSGIPDPFDPVLCLEIDR